jgi:hypothetical protein
MRFGGLEMIVRLSKLSLEIDEEEGGDSILPSCVKDVELTRTGRCSHFS